MFHPKILTGSPERGVKQGKIRDFQALNVNISKTIGYTSKVIISD